MSKCLGQEPSQPLLLEPKQVCPTPLLAAGGSNRDTGLADSAGSSQFLKLWVTPWWQTYSRAWQ